MFSKLRRRRRRRDAGMDEGPMGWCCLAKIRFGAV